MDLEEYVRGEKNMSEGKTFIRYQDGVQIDDKDRDKDKTLTRDRYEGVENVSVPVDYYKQMMSESMAFRMLYGWAVDGESAENIKQQLIGTGGLIQELCGSFVFRS